MNKPTSTKSPTRSSAHVSCLRCAIAFPPQENCKKTNSLRGIKEFLQIFVRCMKQLIGRTLKINLSVAHHENIRGRGFPTKSRLGTIAANGHNAVRSLIETVSRESEGILHALGRKQARHALQIAAAQDQCDDRLRSYRVEPRRGRIVKHERRTIYQRSRNRNAAPHAA